MDTSIIPTEERIEDNRRRIEEILRATNRPGIESVLKFMADGDFYHRPSSDNRHHNWRGGLAQHSLSVYDHASQKYPKLPADSIAICALLHDLCKIDQFTTDADGKAIPTGAPNTGHGDKSVEMLRDLGVELSPEEERSIRWHRSPRRTGLKDSEDLRRARNDSLWWAIKNADVSNVGPNFTL